MDNKTFINDINATIQDIKDTDFDFFNKDYIPGVDDSSLTYEYGDTKKGITVNTCVLFVDMRNSVELVKKHSPETMGKIYTTFTKCVLKAAREYGGLVRNIIGDRVMIVFEPKDCCTTAVNCAITINHIAGCINKMFPKVNFKCGIGIDYGEMNIIKVGLPVHGQENDDNKGLVWVGTPANIASRLTDTANKMIEENSIDIQGLKFEYNYLLSLLPHSCYHHEVLSPEDFLSRITLDIKTSKFRIEPFEVITSLRKNTTKTKYKPILMTEAVYKTFAKDNPNRNSVTKKMWQLQGGEIRDVSSPVYGGNVIWKLN